MSGRRLLAVFALSFLLTPCCLAGTVYRVTSTDDKKETTYEVTFGGGRLNDQMTAYDPVSKKFVYLQWNRKDKKPDPVGSIWDHKTGETIPLYKFPDVKHPLPAIPSINDLKICPITGGKILKKERYLIFD